MRVLVINWRDLESPWAGGAEVHIQAICAGLVRLGHEVTLLVSRFPGCAAESYQSGVRVLRAGSRWDANVTLAVAARRELRRRSYDVVVEDINKIPFFTPVFHDLPMVVYVPHLFGTTVFRETNPLFASYVWLMERPIPRVYRRAQFIAISRSTAGDLVERGIAAERVHVVHCGLEFERYDRPRPPARFEVPTLIHLGRLMRYKSVDVAIRALSHVRRQLPEARLIVVGSGPDQPRLERLARRLGLGEAVTFRGYLPHAAKVDLLWRSHVLLNPSPKEGWGLTVVEANACGVPVVASRAPGLRDSVRDGETGILVPYGDAAAFARATLELLRDPDRREAMGTRARQWAAGFRWEDAAVQTEQILRTAVDEGSAGAGRRLSTPGGAV